MSTVALQQFVKQGSLEKMQALAASLPQSLDELAAAEQMVHTGVLQWGRKILQHWSAVATAKTIETICEHWRAWMKKARGAHNCSHCRSTSARAGVNGEGDDAAREFSRQRLDEL